ncbi:MAG TPA: lipoyl(octanoyl) transferase LipB [Kofleriaceae bacterium]|nr:lipoyl(octanoyl) transferase LipB [Kofleriaceae bacterium]
MTAALPWWWLGRVGYARGTAIQAGLRDALLAGDEDAAGLVLLEHEPVITLGRGARAANVVRPGAAPVVPASRGGDVTYHGPGQLMVYPVVRLRAGVVAYLEALAGALAEVAAALGAPGARWQRNPAGLWVHGAKLAACGIHVRRGIAVHGFALDVATPAAAWQAIVPCGIAGAKVTSIARESGRAPPPMPEVAELAAPLLCRALGYEPVRRDCLPDTARATIDPA